MVCAARSAVAGNASVPGNVTLPHPTVENLSIEWALSGDDNEDGVVSVRYRKLGHSRWLDGMPLRRIPAGSSEGFSWPNRHAGSLLDLKPGTTYEIELKLSDPDGGSTQKVITASTRAVPRAPAGATVRSVTPSTFSSAAQGAKPGQILELAAGTYSGFSFPASGTAQAPIVIRGVSRSSVIINGDARFDRRDHVFLESVTVNGTVRIDDTTGAVVRGCLIKTSDNGVVAYGPATGAYVVDNEVLGPTGWTPDAQGANGNNHGEGIQMTGPGNIIAYNYVKGFRDCISTMEDYHAHDQVSVDIYNNDIEVGADDAIEADFTMGNSRVVRNRITNSYVGLSSQPGLGGPAYFIRNVMYNVIYTPFKLHRGSVGDIAYHNTVVKCGDAFAVFTTERWSRAHFRNNLFIGGTGGGTYGGYSNGSGAVASLSAADSTCSFDHDGYGSIGTGTFRGRIGGTSFSSLAELRSKTTEHDACEVDMSVFAASVAFPSSPFPLRAIPDLRIKAGCAGADKGQIIPNVNDGYRGAAPDLGAHEAGAPLPLYGPRTSPDAHVCGNGDREGPEDCDDGNTVAGDGCSSTCGWETGVGGVTPTPDAGATAPDGAPSAPDLGPSAPDAGVPGDGGTPIRGDGGLTGTGDVGAAPGGGGVVPLAPPGDPRSLVGGCGVGAGGGPWRTGAPAALALVLGALVLALQRRRR